MPSIKDDFKRWTTDVNPTHEKVLAGKLAKLGPKDHGSGWGAFWFIHIANKLLRLNDPELKEFMARTTGCFPDDISWTDNEGSEQSAAE